MARRKHRGSPRCSGGAAPGPRESFPAAPSKSLSCVPRPGRRMGHSGWDEGLIHFWTLDEIARASSSLASCATTSKRPASLARSSARAMAASTGSADADKAETPRRLSSPFVVSFASSRQRSTTIGADVPGDSNPLWRAQVIADSRSPRLGRPCRIGRRATAVPCSRFSVRQLRRGNALHSPTMDTSASSSPTATASRVRAPMCFVLSRYAGRAVPGTSTEGSCGPSRKCVWRAPSTRTSSRTIQTTSRTIPRWPTFTAASDMGASRSPPAALTRSCEDPCGSLRLARARP
jgi:hypothetical protein